MFNFMVSGFEFGIFYDCHNPQAAILLVVLYMFVVAVIFLNLLVGIMTDSWSKVGSPAPSSCLQPPKNRRPAFRSLLSVRKRKKRTTV